MAANGISYVANKLCELNPGKTTEVIMHMIVVSSNCKSLSDLKIPEDYIIDDDIDTIITNKDKEGEPYDYFILALR